MTGKGQKIAISGKGGVGKTTLASLLAYLYAREGWSVLAVDADPSLGLASALGFPRTALAELRPISQMAELITERTGARPGSGGGLFVLNPKVDDIPERFSALHRGVRLIQMGTVKRGGGGCMCPENALLESLLNHLILDRLEVVIVDMEAGTEHLGRGTARGVDALIVVVEPGRRSLATAGSIAELATDLNLGRVYLAGNKVRGEADREFIRRNGPDIPILGFLSLDEQAVEADLKGLAVLDTAPRLVAEAEDMFHTLRGLQGG